MDPSRVSLRQLGPLHIADSITFHAVNEVELTAINLDDFLVIGDILLVEVL